MSGMRTLLAAFAALVRPKKVRNIFHARVTALANIPLTLFLVGALVVHAGADYTTMTAFLGNPLVGVVMLLLIVSATYHMKLGLQVVIEDYVHGEATKLLAIIANQFFALTIAVACSLAVLKLVIG